MYYDVFFYTMLQKKKLERHIARLIYVLTRPEDVTRRDVLRLLVLQKKYSKPPKHIIALLSLFKSYKPELVPEKIQSVNIESVWKPISEFIRLALEDARDRMEIQQSRQSTQTYFNWNVICTLESHSHVETWTLPPRAVIYGAFISKSCALLSRVCKLLLRYRQMRTRSYQIMPSDIYEERIRIICIYANDIHKALWYDESFSDRKNGILLSNLSNKVIKDLGDCDLDILLNIVNHYAVLPYRYTMNKTGLNISTKEDAKTMALYYYPAVNEFLAAFTSD
ncbi:hypothetical protein EAG_15872 [Camponotus floridanus]|uniref:Uncharacterized protein n=1 Tax=Camponotus floridanus TaxID=104421 RepID=E2ACP8_CAMFO|nr:hypothetical protein EAG_15872 [Camponotus floridanus]